MKTDPVAHRRSVGRILGRLRRQRLLAVAVALGSFPLMGLVGRVWMPELWWGAMLFSGVLCLTVAIGLWSERATRAALARSLSEPPEMAFQSSNLGYVFVTWQGVLVEKRLPLIPFEGGQHYLSEWHLDARKRVLTLVRRSRYATGSASGWHEHPVSIRLPEGLSLDDLRETLETLKLPGT